MDETKKGTIGVVAFLLCVSFFLLPLAQYTQDSRIASTAWEIATSKSITVGWEIVNSRSTTASYDISELIASDIDDLDSDDINESGTANIDELTESGINEPGTVDISELVMVDSDELETADKEVSNYSVDISGKNSINFLTCILLIIPVAVIILVFTKISLTVLRYISLIGIVANIAFIIVVYVQWRDYFIPTIFSWIILAIYIGLYAFSQKDNMKKIKLAIVGAAVVIFSVSIALLLVNSFMNSPKGVFQRFTKAIEENNMRLLVDVATSDTVQLVTMYDSSIQEYAVNPAAKNGKIKTVTETTTNNTVIVSVIYEDNNKEKYDLIRFDRNTSGISVTYEKWYGKIKTVTEPINSDAASVSVIYKNGNEEKYDLIRVNGKWKVHIPIERET